MRVYETWQNGCASKINDLCTCRRRMRARRADVDDVIAPNDDVLVASRLGACTVNEQLRSNDEGLSRSLSEADI